MRVIKSGSDKEWLVTCRDCGADLMYTGRDVHTEDAAAHFRKLKEVPQPVKYRAPEFPLVGSVTAFVVCPECGCQVKVPLQAGCRTPYVHCGGDWE